MTGQTVTFQDRLAVIRIPEGYGPGDLVVLEIAGDQVLVAVEVLERLVRAYHQLDEGPTDAETGEPIGDHVECSCGWSSTKTEDRGSLRGQHETHVRFEVHQAWAGRATA